MYIPTVALAAIDRRVHHASLNSKRRAHRPAVFVCPTAVSGSIPKPRFQGAHRRDHRRHGRAMPSVALFLPAGECGGRRRGLKRGALPSRHLFGAERSTGQNRGMATARQHHPRSAQFPPDCLDGNGGLVCFPLEACQAVLEKSPVGHKAIDMACLPVRVCRDEGERDSLQRP